MPIYEYQCQSCGERLETMQSLSDPPLTTCPECSGELKKLISAPAFQFKGSGWYVTDYARKGNGAKDGAKEEGGKSAASGEGKGGKEPAAKPASETSSGGSGKSAKSAAS